MFSSPFFQISFLSIVCFYFFFCFYSFTIYYFFFTIYLLFFFLLLIVNYYLCVVDTSHRVLRVNPELPRVPSSIKSLIQFHGVLVDICASTVKVITIRSSSLFSISRILIYLIDKNRITDRPIQRIPPMLCASQSWYALLSLFPSSPPHLFLNII